MSTCRLIVKETLLSNEVFTDEMMESFLMRSDINYLLYDDVMELFDMMQKEYPQLVEVTSFGESYEGRNIPLLTVTLNKES